jgi:ATP-binding cassette subfamily F protein 3
VAPVPPPQAKAKAKPTATAPGCAGEKLAAATAAALTGNGSGGSAVLSKNARRMIRDLEREIERAEEGLKAIETELAEPAAWSTPDRTAQSTERHAAAKRAVEEAFARWEAAAS